MKDFFLGDIARFVRTLALLIPLIIFVPTWLMPHISVDLKDVHVDSDQGEEVIVVATRDTHESWASYTTIIRDAITNVSVCDSPRQQRARRYKENTTPFITVSLAWWMGTGEDVRVCRALGLQADTPYIMKTCHYWHGSFNVVLARRCVDSNVFTLSEENIWYIDGKGE